MKFISDDLKRSGRLTEKVNPPCLIDMIHGAREEVIDACIRMLQSEHELVHQLYIKLMKNRPPGKQMFNVVHPDWIEWSNKNSKMMEFMEKNPLPALNNHTCPHCKNERVSKDEKSCWLCGGLL